MAVYRVNKNRGYTVMANYHLRDKTLSLKAVGLLSKMLSFNDGWQFSTKGLSAICKEGPDAVLAALRELEEETGAHCGRFEYLGVCYPSVAYLTEKIHMYLARDLEFGSSHTDAGEFLDVLEVPLDEAVQMVMDGKIPDAKTQIALLKTKMIVDSGK